MKSSIPKLSSLRGPDTDHRTEVPVIALPEADLSLEQDAEWCVVRQGQRWREIRFHDYHEIFDTPGLYEHLFHNVLKCRSPKTVVELMCVRLHADHRNPSDLRVLDVGAGNGLVGEALRRAGCHMVIGIDILDAARDAAFRDRPEVYDDYLVADLAQLPPETHARLQGYDFNALTCVAALGFGDIPPHAFAAAYNLLSPGAQIGFNIKQEFLGSSDDSGFSRLVRRCASEDIFDITESKHYRHRLSTNGDPLIYVAMCCTKQHDIPEGLLEADQEKGSAI